MQFSDPSSEASRPFANWQRIADWAQTHYRNRIFAKDERIPARQGLLYLVNQGAIRLVGKTQLAINEDSASLSASENSSKAIPKEDIISPSPENRENGVNQEFTSSGEYSDDLDEAFLGFIQSEQPFEIVAENSFNIEAYAHVEDTEVIWLYWHDLETWPQFRKEVYEAIRYQNQRKLLWLSALGQRKTIERLMAFLTLLIEQYGQPCKQGHCLPYTLTHAQIGSTIGSTRVTVTRLMGKLRRQGAILIIEDNLICLPAKD